MSKQVYAVIKLTIDGIEYNQKVVPNNPSGWTRKDNNNIDKWKKYFRKYNCEVLKVTYE